MTEASDNPVSIVREMLDEPVFKRRICAALGVPEDTEIDDESFHRAAEIMLKTIPDECPMELKELSCDEFKARQYKYKKYIVFQWDWHYPTGGLSDIAGSFDTIEEARAYFIANEKDSNEIVDRDTWEIVDEG